MLNPISLSRSLFSHELCEKPKQIRYPDHLRQGALPEVFVLVSVLNEGSVTEGEPQLSLAVKGE
jgi:hypothetical protein